MPDFTLYIPFEIFSDILSHVNQVDLIECMFVCRRWYKLIPDYAKDNLEELEISKTSWPRFNKAMSQCLGPHIKQVSIIGDENSSKTLRRLKEQGCNIQFLEIKGRFRFYDLELDRRTIFSGIGCFGRTLKELYIKGSTKQDCPWTLLLDQLPFLTHFTFRFEGGPYQLTSEYDKSINEMTRQNFKTRKDKKNTYNLVFLSLGSLIFSGNSTREVLERCPRLQFLIGSFCFIHQELDIRPFSIPRILELCPSIRYISWGEEIFPSKIEEEWLTLSRGTENNDTDNKNVNNYGERDTKKLRQVIFSSAEELEHIATLEVILEEPSMLKHLQLSGRSFINLSSVWNIFARRNSNLLSQPSQLKSLELSNYYVTYQPENVLFFENFFNYFQHIEYLNLDFMVTSNDNLKDVPRYMPNLAHALGHQLHQLRYLYLSFTYDDNWKIIMAPCDDLSTYLCSWNQKLEVLHLHNVPVSNNMLLDLCHHPNLHTLKLSGRHLHKYLTKDGWILFARKLKDPRQSGCGRIQSMLLSCGYCDDVTDEVLEELAGIKSLETLRIACNNNITDAGVNKFASTANSIGKKHNKIELYLCNNVSLENPHAVCVPIPFL